MSERSGRRGEDGFTLIEMLVVLVVIGLIAAVAIPQVMKLLGNAKAKATRIQLQTVSNSLNYFQLDVGRYPTDQEGLAVLLKAPANTPEWSGPYARNDKQLIDPWGRPLIYKAVAPASTATADVAATDNASATSSSKPYLLESLGADGKPGGTGDDQDIVADQ